MSIQLIQDRLDRYACRSSLEEDQAVREISQEIVLAGLGRTDFFKRAGFQGGTCLRIFRGLNRFSEGLDFALLAPDSSFALPPYLETLTRELAAYGYEFEIEDRSNAAQAVRKAFLKDDSMGSLLRLSYRPANGPLRKLRIKLEVDTRPPAGAAYETKVLDFPFPSAVCLLDLPSLFAGKIHALLCREYMKGRDWYDFIWYTAHRTPIQYGLLSSALRQNGPWQGQVIAVDRDWCVNQLHQKITSINWQQARRDVQRFIKPPELPSLALWSPEFFLSQCEKLPTD
jgi:predicted nucleotidyltransferase component of viral defense system